MTHDSEKEIQTGNHFSLLLMIESVEAIVSARSSLSGGAHAIYFARGGLEESTGSVPTSVGWGYLFKCLRVNFLEEPEEQS